MDFENRATALVVSLGLARNTDILSVKPLTGGVASDIGAVETTAGTFCVKFALERLRVAQDWRVPVTRNKSEYDWLSVAGQVAPGAAPRLFGRDAALGGFAMEMIAGPDVTLWKSDLLAGRSTGQEAALVAGVLGHIHAAGASTAFDRSRFANRDLFRDIRIEPYLSFTATRHPKVADQLLTLADSLFDAEQTLVHGDISPKNILLRGGKPIFLDAECATMGDPSFDLAFCMNHLVLKALHVNRATLGAVGVFWRAYAPHVYWEDASRLQARVAALIPALMLARIDGKSPVEYLSDPMRDRIRQLSLDLLTRRHATLDALIADIGAQE